MGIFVWIKLSQHYTFRTGTFDLSMYDSALSNTLKGNFMYTPWLERSYFSEHFAPILLLLLPFYLVHDSAVTLVIIHAIATVLAVLPLYHFAAEKLSHRSVAFCIVVSYLNYEYLLHGFLFDFHMEIFIPLLMFSAFWFLYRNAPVQYFITLVLLLMCKEDIPIYMFMVGGYACLRAKKWKLGIPTMLISVAWALFAWKIAIPMSYPDGVRTSHFLGRWAHYGQTYTQVAWGLFTHPTEIFGELFWKNSMHLVSPLGFLPLADPVAFFLSLPPLLLNITSNFDIQKNLYAHYALPLLPFLFIALIGGINNLCKTFPQQRHLIAGVACCYLLIANIDQLEAFPITPHDYKGHQVINMLPDGISISAQTSLIPHLRRSHQVYLLPENPDCEYVFFDTERFTWPMSDEEYAAILQRVKDNQQYTLIFHEEGFYLFRRRADK
jgi:uncharacterized membrane protein